MEASAGFDQVKEKAAETGIVAVLSSSALDRQRLAAAFDATMCLDAEELAAWFHECVTGQRADSGK